jgi:hypothetical protein
MGGLTLDLGQPAVGGVVLVTGRGGRAADVSRAALIGGGRTF